MTIFEDVAHDVVKDGTDEVDGGIVLRGGDNAISLDE